MLRILWRCKAGENKNWCQSFEWKIIYQFDSFHEEGYFVHVSSLPVLPSPPPRTSTPFPWLTDWMFSATGNNRPTPLSLILHSVRTVVPFAHQNCEDGKLNMFIVILFGRNWSTYLHREFTLQTSRCLCASSVWLSCHMHYWPFHIAMTLKTVSTRNTKLVKIAIEPIARAFATPCNIKSIQNQNSRAHIYISIHKKNLTTYIWCMLVCVNLFRPHRNEEEEPKEVEQEHLGHSLGSSRKSVHERHRNSDGWQVKWSVFRAIWLKRQDP